MHLVPMLRVGGMEHGIVKVVNGLDPRRVSSAICSFHPADSLRDLVNEDVPVFEFAKRAGNDPLLIGHLVRLLRSWCPHVVHTHSWGTLFEGYLAAHLARVPFIMHGEHGTMELKPLNVRVQRYVWTRVDRLLSVSSRLADRMARDIGIARQRIITIRNGVDLERFGRISRSDAKCALGFAPGELVIGTVGRLVPVKDHCTLLHALAHLAAAGTRFRAVIVGDGPLRADLVTLRAQLGLAAQVDFLESRQDVDRIFAALDLFVLSSTSEGLSNTILEAMASGLPVVATRVGGADELVEEGRTGRLVPSSDPQSLADALTALATDVAAREAFGRAGRQRAHAEFGIASMVASFQNLYEGLLAASKVHHDIGLAV